MAISDQVLRVIFSLPLSFVFLLSLPYNMGIGSSVQAGYMWAEKHHYDFVVRMDGDGQHSPTDLAIILKHVVEGRCDMGIGSRFISKQTEGYSSSFFRRIGIYYLRFLIRLTTGKTILDPTSGYIACNREVLQCFSQYYPHDYPEPEALLLMSQKGKRVKEISATMRKRNAGNSSIRFIDTFYYLLKVSLALLLLHRKTY